VAENGLRSSKRIEIEKETEHAYCSDSGCNSVGVRSGVGAGIRGDNCGRGINFLLGPGVNIYRSPLNGRNFEYFGEDPFLTSSIAVGYIKGMQSQGVSATIKHFLGNNSEYLRHDSDSVIDERTLREI
jgi:beta-glucosidase